MDYTQTNENHHEYISKASGLSYIVALTIPTVWYVAEVMARNLHMKGIIFLNFNTRKQGFNQLNHSLHGDINILKTETFVMMGFQTNIKLFFSFKGVFVKQVTGH